MSIFQVLVLGFLFVSFRSTLFYSHSRLTGDSFRISPSGRLHDFRFLSSTSVLAIRYSASVSSVLFFPVLSYSDFSSASVLPFGFTVFHLIFHLVSHISFQVSGTWLSVCFLSSFPVSLPQLFHRCFPLSTSLRLFLCRDCLRAFHFLSSVSFRFWLLGFLTFFSLLLDFPCQRFNRNLFPL